MKKTLIITLCCLSGLPVFARSGASQTADQHFIRKAGQANYAEIQLGKLAAEKGTNPVVKNFGQRMVADHTKAYDALKPIAAKENVPLPDKMNARNQALYDRLSKLSGDQFDRDYIHAMTKDHQADVAEFQRESEQANDPDVRSYAQKMLPVLQEHMRLAEDANTKLGSNATR